MIEDFEDPICNFPLTEVVLPDPKDVLSYPTTSEHSTLLKQEVLNETDLAATGVLKDM